MGSAVIPLVRSTSEEVSRSESLLKTEIEHDEFCLYVQSMQPVVPHEGADRFHEILVRYKAEEESLSAPGLFVPMAEQNGMMPLLDKWAIRDLLKWIAEDESRRRGLYSLNISFDTLNDSRFTSFVEEELVASGVPGTTLCFEIQESDISRDPAAIAQRILKLKGAGCKFAICGFGEL